MCASARCSAAMSSVEPLVAEEAYKAQITEAEKAASTAGMDVDQGADANAATPKEPVLVAGEIGYTCGNVYTSCTGYYSSDFSGAGTAQLYLLGQWLKAQGLPTWDLGMVMDYKRDLGGKEVPRTEWLQKVRDCRDAAVDLTVENFSVK